MAVHVPERPEPSLSDAPEKGIAEWLAWLGAFPGNRSWSGIVEFTSETDQGSLVAGYPVAIKGPAAAMLVARKARVSGRATTVRMPTNSKDKRSSITSPVKSLMAVPLTGDTSRIVLLYGPLQTPEQQKSTIALCRWAGLWLSRTRQACQAAQPVDNATHSLADAVLNAAFVHRTPESVSRAVVNSVKRLCGCERVSLAIHQHHLADAGALKLISLSDQASVDVRKVLPTQIMAAMREVLCSEPSSQSADPHEHPMGEQSAQKTLFMDQGEHPALVLVYPPVKPLDAEWVKSKYTPLTRVVLLLERPVGQEFSEAQSVAIRSALEPSLDLVACRFDREMSALTRLGRQWHRTTDHEYLASMGLRHRWKLIAGSMVVISLLIPVPHKISAHAAIESKDLQVLIAPQDGFVSTSHARAGDLVQQHQLLATLDTQDLKLAAGKWRSETAKNEQALQQALATRDRVALGRLRADAVRIAAELELVVRQITRSELRAPFNGVVLSGDLNQQLGAAVTRGETLFTVAASDEYRLVLELEEQDVGLVRTGQSAQVRLSALPDMTWEAAIDTVLPVATSTEDKHVFRVPALLSQRSSSLLPGMEGVARLHVGSRSLAWVYTRTLREKTRLLFWRLGFIR